MYFIFFSIEVNFVDLCDYFMRVICLIHVRKIPTCLYVFFFSVWKSILLTSVTISCVLYVLFIRALYLRKRALCIHKRAL